MMDEKVRCPKCGSTQLHADKKGFSTGKAVVGTVAGGVLVGAAMGGSGSNRIVITCLKCGCQFKPGDNNNKSSQKDANIVLTEDQKRVNLIFVLLSSLVIILTMFIADSIKWIFINAGICLLGFIVMTSLLKLCSSNSISDEKNRLKEPTGEYLLIIEINGEEVRLPYKNSTTDKELLMNEATLFVEDYVANSNKEITSWLFVNIIPG